MAISSLTRRAVIWTSLWNLTRDGEWPAQNYVDTVLKHAVGEAPSLLTTALANAAGPLPVRGRRQ